MRVSVRIGRTFSPARNVLSRTAPLADVLQLGPDEGRPLPGLTCWNSIIRKTWPSTSMWVPFLNWLVEIESRVTGMLYFAPSSSVLTGMMLRIESPLPIDEAPDRDHEVDDAEREGVGTGRA